MAYKINELNIDEFGRKSGILAVNKPIGMTSHDVVARLRGILGLRKIGHAGALDPFASGVLIILVGKATKLSDKFVDSDKEYIFELLLGIKTDSGDPEGKILETNTDYNQVATEQVTDTFANFQPEYDQYPPIYSSVKIDGQKLRVLARKAESFTVAKGETGRFATFQLPNSEKQIEIPSTIRKIFELELLEITKTDPSKYFPNFQSADNQLQTLKIRTVCSKGTYVRVLGQDIAEKLDPSLPACLVTLQRTRVDRIALRHSLSLEQVADRYSTSPTNS